MATVTIAAGAEPVVARTPEQIERYWFENVYQGDRLKQLTARAVIMGMGLGMIMACSNVYIGLKAGWSMGVTITSAVLAFTIFQAISGTLGPLLVRAHRLPLVGRFFQWLWPENDYSILENNCLQTTAGAAGSMTSAGLVNAIPALMMLSAASIPADFGTRCLWLIPWVCSSRFPPSAR